MTKFYFLLFICLFTGMNAQTLPISHLGSRQANDNFPATTFKDSDPVFNQDITYAGLLSLIDENGNSIFGAEDVVFTNNVKIDKVVLYGDTWQTFNLIDSYLGARFIIFEDENGKPKGVPSNAANTFFYKDLNQNDQGITIEQVTSYTSRITIDLAVLAGHSISMQANKTYWFSFALKQNLDGQSFLSNKAWYWNASSINLLKPHLIDEDNYMGLGTDWLAVEDYYSAFGETLSPLYNGFNIIIYGESTLGIRETYSSSNTIFPNPAKDFIQFQDSSQISKAEIFNLAGQVVLTSFEKRINVMNLKSGVYLIKQYKKDGSQETTKFIKE